MKGPGDVKGGALPEDQVREHQLEQQLHQDQRDKHGSDVGRGVAAIGRQARRQHHGAQDAAESGGREAVNLQLNGTEQEQKHADQNRVVFQW